MLPTLRSKSAHLQIPFRSCIKLTRLGLKANAKTRILIIKGAMYCSRQQQDLDIIPTSYGPSSNSFGI